MTDIQRTVARIAKFAAAHGRCCAGCDHWNPYNSVAGECTRTAPVGGGVDRVALLGITQTSANIGAGHVLTPRDHSCGEYLEYIAK